MVNGEKSKGFEDLEVWRLSIIFAKEVYLITSSFPKEEMFGLVSQIRRSCVSISANIAEGSAKGTKADFARYVSIALGSTAELKSLIILAGELNYLPKETVKHLTDKNNQIGRMLKGLHRSLKV